MFLKSIVLKGFKSFPDRTRLEFGPGVSVIVGPNGSGKSNITDAVLWALGEQSPVAVRGQSMQDVIFAGAPGRQASSAAEVELVLDDSDGTLGLGVPEVSIVRRLERTGEGEYRLAGARCRLVDVIEVLSDTGLGKEMHSVISQGRVEAIVTSKPRERRLAIEEAAGLGKHRKRRRRAQLKLIRTQANLDRALDVEREARARLRPLKRQAEAAELHARLERQSLELRWELARDDLRASRIELARAQARATEARARQQQLERELELIAARREAAEEALASRSAQREELSRRSFAAQSAAQRVDDRAHAIRAAAATLQARLERARQQLEALRQVPEAEGGDQEAAARIERLEAELNEVELERERRLAAELAGLEEQAAAARSATSELAAAVEEARARREEVERRSERASQQVREAERRVEQARREAARIGGELAAVNQFLRVQAGRPGGAPALAEQLEVDPGYELALAAALDGRLGAAVVADLAAAGRVLDRAGAEGGRALVLGEGSPAADAGEGAPAPGQEPGRERTETGAPGEGAPVPGQEPGRERTETGAPVAGAERLADRLRGPAAAVALARTLLHDTWVVPSLDSLPAAFAGVAVTREGRVWSAPTREVRQAPALGEERVLAERNRREELIRASERAAAGEAEAQRALAAATDAHREVEGEREAAIAALRARDEAAEQERRLEAMIARRRTAPEEGPAEERRRRLTQELAAERAARERVARERAERRARLERLSRSVAHDEELLPLVRSLGETLERLGEAISLRRAQFEAALVADRRAGEDLAAELRGCAQQEASTQAQMHAANQAVTEAEVALLRARDRAGELERELDGLARRLELSAEPATEELAPEQREALRGRLERLARRREQLGPVNPLAQQEYAEALEHVEELERQREDLETALRELQTLIADTDRQIRELFEQTFTAAARHFEQVAAQLFPGGSGRLRLVKEGPAPARVLGAAAAADEEAEAAAELEEEAAEAEPAEEEQLGVEIEINPAGKEMKRLTLLSGGEKSMTALAFLFAVFLARPCPFYILDEVEAALDDLNIDRFLGLLRAYAGQAQFIVVTHQRRTMEAADFLYGVSMGPDGVSKVISQRLSPAAEAA